MTNLTNENKIPNVLIIAVFAMLLSVTGFVELTPQSQAHKKPVVNIFPSPLSVEKPSTADKLPSDLQMHLANAQASSTEIFSKKLFSPAASL